MKKILFFLLLSISAFSQTTLPVTTSGAVNRGYQNLGTVMFDTHLRIPVGNTTPNYSNVTNKGLLRVNSVTNVLEYHNGTGWVSFTELIDDSITVTNKTWSSDKITEAIESSIDSLNIASVNSITELESYSGSQTTLIVKDSLRGGIFNYVATGTADNGIVFNATGKGSGYWKRQHTQSEAINVQWYGVVSDYDYDLGTGTDNADVVQDILDGFDKRTVHLHFPASSNPNLYYGFSHKIDLGQNTKITGENEGFPRQNGVEVLEYNIPTVLYFYNNSDGFESPTDVNYRGQLPKFENIAILGSGNDNTKTGLKFSSNPSYTVADPNAQDVGLVTINNVFIDSFQIGVDAVNVDTMWLNQCHISNCTQGFIGGKQDIHISSSCFFDLNEGIRTSANYAVITGNEIEPSVTGTGIILNNARSCVLTNNTFKVNLIGLLLENGSSLNTISDNIFANTKSNSIVLNGAGSYNSIINNNIWSSFGSSILATSTNRLTIKDNIISDQLTVSGVAQPAIKLITCDLAYVSAPFNNQFNTAKYFDITGTTSNDEVTTSNSIVYGYENYNPSPLIKFRKANGTMETPTAITSNAVIGGLQGEGYSTFFANRLGLEMRANENWTGSANGGKIVMSMANNGATAKTDRHTFTYSGYTSSGTITATGNVAGATATSAGHLTRFDQVVRLSDDQTKAGVLTLLNSPIVPTATTSTQAVNLGQLSDYTEASVNEVILGTWDFQSSSNIGFRRAFISSNSTNTSLSVDNASTGYGVEIRNFANGSAALYVDNQQNGNGVVVDSDISTTGKNFIGKNNGTDTFTIDRTGDVVANKYTKTGGVATEFLMADGSVNTISAIVGVAGSFSGVGTATTVFTVTIGATQPNNTYKVNATPTNLLSAALFYVTNKTTTTFDVVYLAGLTGTVEFDWVLRP